MAELPGISCYCSTYGRPAELIENAIWCFLQQDYAGPKELVILNDFDQQELVFDHPEVRIINHSERVKPLGRKFNLNVALCKYPILAVWEDDDIFLRHRLSYSYARMRNGVFHSNDAFIEHAPGELGVMSNLFHSQHMFTQELFDRVGGYSEEDRGSIDVTLMDAIRREISDYSQPIPTDELFYVYVWSGANSFHGSGMGADNAAVSDSAAEYVARQVKEGRVKTGKVYLNPRPRYDVYEYLPTKQALFRPGNLRITYGLDAGPRQDVTARIARLCTVASGEWTLPADDVARAQVLGDPAPNFLKQVWVQQIHPDKPAPLAIGANTATFRFKDGVMSADIHATDSTPASQPTIFVNIASYRDDHELWATVKDAVLKADHPGRVRIAVVDQTATPATPEQLALAAPAQIEYLYVDYKFGRGPCWARAVGYTLLYEEDYVLQIDSHSRFDPGWDTWFVDTIKRLQQKSPKPYVSMMPYSFMYENGTERKDRNGGVTINLLPNEGPITGLANGYTGSFCGHSEDLEGSHISAGCVFAPAELFRQVLVDPALYFIGEQHNFTVRAFTHGWDLFFVAGQPVFHLFNDNQCTVRSPHWNEEDDRQRRVRWWQYDGRSTKRQRELLTAPQTLGAYGLGTVRTLADYATKFGVDYLNMEVRVKHNTLMAEYEQAKKTPSDINENLYILHELAQSCNHVTEMGVRTGVSTRAFLAANCELTSYDIVLDETVHELFSVAKAEGKKVSYIKADTLNLEIEPTDLLFIDTLHNYYQLKTELELHGNKSRKYLAFHDTHTFGLHCETASGAKGLLPAIIEFTIQNPHWRFKIYKTNNNGLTVLERIETENSEKEQHGPDNN